MKEVKEIIRSKYRDKMSKWSSAIKLNDDQQSILVNRLDKFLEHYLNVSKLFKIETLLGFIDKYVEHIIAKHPPKEAYRILHELDFEDLITFYTLAINSRYYDTLFWKSDELEGCLKYDISHLA